MKEGGPTERAYRDAMGGFSPIQRINPTNATSEHVMRK